MAVQSALYLLERAGHLERSASAERRAAVNEPPPWANATATRTTGTASTGTAAVPPASSPPKVADGRNSDRRARSIVMLDSTPATKLRVEPGDVTRRAALERRKLREMIEFCYTEYCYRANILDYFGDRHHARQCGACGNCAPHSVARKPLTGDELLEPPAPVRSRKGRSAATASISTRVLSNEESLCVRKILACAMRMKGRFGKTMLAATLRGSAAKNVMQAHLNELSTYGLLRDIRQEDTLLYIDALCAAGCLRISAGAYPTVSITELGGRVMREQEQIQLALPEQLS
jgi:hypothetical protein